MIKELALKNRSYRRFYQDKKIDKATLIELVDIASKTPSGANAQSTRYKISCTEEENAKVFKSLRWAGYFKDWDGPVEGERPAGYVILVGKKDKNAAHDEGIIGQTILLAAVEKGLGGCFIGNIDRAQLDKDLNIPEGMTVKLVIALGVPKEEVVIETVNEGDDIKYYRDEQQVHHVPKIKLEDLLLD